PLSGFRCGTAVPLPVGGSLPGRDHCHARVRHGRLSRNPRLPGHPDRGLYLRLAERGLLMALENLADNVLFTQLDWVANLARKHSLWPMPFATACCGIELMATSASRHDIARFGS